MKTLFSLLIIILLASCETVNPPNKRAKVLVYRQRTIDTIYVEYYNSLFISTNNSLMDDTESRFALNIDAFSILSTETISKTN